MNISVSSMLIPLFPLLGFLVIGLGGKQLSKSLIGVIGCGSILASFILSCTIFFSLLNGTTKSFTVDCFSWIHAGGLSIPFSFLIDPLSSLMLLVITGVGFLIHLYSVGYMHEDEGFHRFFAYMNLFIVFMLLLVMGDNFAVMFAGWEGVGLCSYLLIGFWFKNTEYNNAAKKAFIMNRIGDLGFILGVFLIFSTFGSIRFHEVFESAKSLGSGSTVVVVITLLLFIGATGKSAQIPLYTWLPDAMAGPTPVSALIHAATMVTAGIYMIARAHILFALAPFTNDIILVIGFATALFAGTIGLAQNDIKKVLAYSTVSQLGFMFIALGLNAYSTAMFHLTTHAFFKALLFLGAGSVIHAMSGEQDIRKMGSLKTKLPITFITFLAGTLALCGLPPFAGFFSKDEILSHALERSPLLMALGLCASILTILYMMRLFVFVFLGKFRGTEKQATHLHESPSVMTMPLMALAVLSVIGGFIGIPKVFGAQHLLGNFLSPVFADLAGRMPASEELSSSMELIGIGISSAVAIAVLFIGYKMYSGKDSEKAMNVEFTGFKKILANKYYVDEIYDLVIVRPLHLISEKLIAPIEKNIFTRSVDSVGRITVNASRLMKNLQAGYVGFYIFAMVIGIILILLFNHV